MPGFRNEAELWTWMRPKLIGKWERCEAIFPAGVPDAFGTHGGHLHFIERKVGAVDIRKMEPSQLEFFDWMRQSASHVGLWVAFGDKTANKVRFIHELDFSRVVLPPWWGGDFIGDLGYNESRKTRKRKVLV